ncbi:hypothetical protein [Halegenticoccus tardaugens]|uniref:hypothetical protein n=1 Tax=Halegenticoccus tardaugens TaxID=2071624 RepID=UPI002B273375|nr:hypothetical protein [Halegenticoccus tardaugens]
MGDLFVEILFEAGLDLVPEGWSWPTVRRSRWKPLRVKSVWSFLPFPVGIRRTPRPLLPSHPTSRIAIFAEFPPHE